MTIAITTKCPPLKIVHVLGHLKKIFPRRLLGELCLETLTPLSSFLAFFLSFFLTISCHVCPFPGSLVHLIPHTMEHILQHLEPLLSMWILNCSRLEPLLSLTETPSFYHRTPTIYARNLKYQLSILDMTKYPYSLN